MKKHIVCILLLTLILLPVIGQSDVDFHNLVDYNAKLEDLCGFVASQPSEVVDSVVQQNRIFLVTGSISSRLVLDADQETYAGEFEIVSGQWIGLEDVQMYRAVIQFHGPQYSQMIPARRSRNANPNEVPLNSFVMVPVLLTGVREYEGVIIPVLEGIGMRIIE
ncbi:MAG: hypothetical protein JEY99_14180 [Spirochaetales bacterium]|nr:hypothetical protein [Spirochaetales bacterium]